SLLKELKDLRKRVQALEGQTRLESASIGRGGLTIKNGGTLQVVDGNGNLLGYMGFWGGAADPNGDPQSGFVFFRNDESGQTPALALLDYNPLDEDGFHQVVTFFDRHAHRVLEDDPGGNGLNNPQFNLTVIPGGDGRNSEASWELAAYGRNNWVDMPDYVRAMADPDRPAWFPAYTGFGVCQHPVLWVDFDINRRGSVGNYQWDIVINSTEAPWYSSPLYRTSGSVNNTSPNVWKKIDLVNDVGLNYEQTYTVKLRVNQGTAVTSGNNLSFRLNHLVESGNNYVPY